jgi:multidrug transporter EmrE-like cation transporter
VPDTRPLSTDLADKSVDSELNLAEEWNTEIDVSGTDGLPRPDSHAAEPPVHRQRACAKERARDPKHGKTSRRHNLTIASAALLLFAVTAAASGQVMLKHGMQTASARAAGSSTSLAVRAATSPWVLLGLAVFAVSAVAWLAVLSRVPLSVAYPFNALGYLIILTTSIVVLHERANVMTWAGTLLVVSGLVVVVLARP